MDKQWTIKTKVDKRNRIQLPPGFMMCSGIKTGDILDTVCGDNFSCVIIHPPGTQISARNRERIKLLVEEPLSKDN